MNYKFECDDPTEDTFLEVGRNYDSLHIELGSYGDFQYGGITTLDIKEIDNLIKALKKIKEGISGKQTEIYEFVTKN